MNTMKVKMAAFAASAAACGLLFAKTEVDPPVLASVPYDGTVQTATVPTSDKWTVAFAESGEHAGTYDVFLRLTDFDADKWTGRDERTIAVPFTIVQAANEWTDGPSISGWTFGGVPSAPRAAARFGAVRPVVYSGTTASGATVVHAAAVSEAGNYTATFDVGGTADYTALHVEVPFAVHPASVARATLSGEARWKLLKATGTYFAQVKVRCTDGYAAGISNLRVGFADRTASGKTLAQLWNSSKRSAVSDVFSQDSMTSRVVSLPASAITGENVDATYGVTSLSAATVPVAERTIELYVSKRNLASHQDEYTAILVWESNGATYTASVENKSVQ